MTSISYLGRSVLLLLALATAHAEELPKTPVEALAYERADALPITEFYSTPANLSASRPGDLLRHESFDGYELPKGATAMRILYHSLSATGRDVASSAAVLLPAGKAPVGGWPVIVWAHGTSGVSRLCGPSLMKDVYYGEEGLMPMVAAGFAVVAVDYHGLATEGPHEYVNKVAQVHDILYSIPAAHAAVPVLSARWVVDGHSQGAVAAWGVAEAEHDINDPTYLGAVSVAGGVREAEFFRHLSSTPGVGFYLAYMAAGIHARYPEFQPRELLSDAALAHYEDVTTKGCFAYAYVTYLSVPSGQLLRAGSEKNPWVHQFFETLKLAEKPIGGPMLILAGEADKTVPISGMRAMAKKMCERAQPVSFRSYPGLDHDPLMEKSAPDQLAWIRERFAGRPALSNCTSLVPGTLRESSRAARTAAGAPALRAAE